MVSSRNRIGPDQTSDPPQQDPEQVEQPSDHRTGEEDRQEEEEDLRADLAPPEGEDQLTEDHPPEDEGGEEGEDRERDPRDRVAAETPLLRREPLAHAELVPEVVLHELERARTEVGDLDQVREDPVPVELQQRDQVQEDHEVVEERELVQEVRERSAGEEEDREAGDAGDHELGERSGGGLQDPLPPVEHQAVRGLHEERRRAEVDHEAGALHLPVVARDHDGVAELVHERQEEREGEEDRRFDGRVLTPELEISRDRDVEERDQTGDRDHPRDQGDGPPEERTQDVPIAESDQPVGALPVDREGLAEALELLASRRRRVQPIGDKLIGGDRGGIEEPSRVQREHQVGDRFRVETSAFPHPFHHELTDGPRAVHLGQELRLPHLEAVVELAVVPREHRVVVAPSRPEDLHLAPVPHPRARSAISRAPARRT